MGYVPTLGAQGPSNFKYYAGMRTAFTQYFACVREKHPLRSTAIVQDVILPIRIKFTVQVGTQYSLPRDVTN